MSQTLKRKVPSERIERSWAMLKTRLTCLSLAGMVLGFAAAAPALTTSDRSAGILVWPKVVVDSSGVLTGVPTDTVITLANNSTTNWKQAHCFYINSTGHCANAPETACFTSADCNASACEPSWNKVDFNVFITRDQPLAWQASEGLGRGDYPIEGPGICDNIPKFCFSDAQCGGGSCQIGPGGQNNIGSAVPPVPEDPFVGSLTCVQYDPTQNPPVPDHSATRNSLAGEADIVTTPDPDSAIDSAKYNAVGFLATPTGDGDNVLQLGGNDADYAGCPQTLILDHFFDGATDPTSVGQDTNSANGTTTTELTLAPCGNDLLSREEGTVVAQFLVFNEFEQRFSASRIVDCFLDTEISNIDTPNNSRSIFNAGVAGTLVGQTRIQGVGNAPTGRGLLGVARLRVEKEDGELTSSAYNLDQNGGTETADLITLP